MGAASALPRFRRFCGLVVIAGMMHLAGFLPSVARETVPPANDHFECHAFPQIMQSFLDERLISLTMFLVLKSHALGRRRGLVARVQVRPQVPRGTCDRHLVERRELLVVVPIYDIIINRVDAARAVVQLREFPRRAFSRRRVGVRPRS